MNSPVTVVLIVITSLVSYKAFNNPDFKMRLIHNPYKVKHQREYYRLLTSGFIHSDFMHLLFNMLTLYFFGQVVEYTLIAIHGFLLGEVIYVGFYLISIVISDISSVVRFGDSPGYNSLGASGAISAVLFFSILFDPLRDVLLYFFFPIPGFMLGAMYLIYSYYQGQRMADNINHYAHLFGAIAGIVFAVATYPGVLLNFLQQVGSYSFF